MTEEKLTTVQVDQETARKLLVIAKANERSKAAQFRFMVQVEFDRMQAAQAAKAGPVYADPIEVA